MTSDKIKRLPVIIAFMSVTYPDTFLPEEREVYKSELVGNVQILHIPWS